MMKKKKTPVVPDVEVFPAQQAACSAAPQDDLGLRYALMDKIIGVLCEPGHTRSKTVWNDAVAAYGICRAAILEK